MFTFEIEGCPFEVVVTSHAEIRMSQRNVQKFACYGSIVSLGDRLLDMLNCEEFCIMDKELDIAVCCAVHYESDSKGMPIVEIHIITVLDSSNFYVKDGVNVYELSI